MYNDFKNETTSNDQTLYKLALVVGIIQITAAAITCLI